MSNLLYIAVFEPAGDGAFGVHFPDLPGCVSWGADLMDAFRNAHEALALHIEGMAEDGEAIPAPSADAGGWPAPPAGGHYAVIAVTAPDVSERVNVYLPKGLIERIDRYAGDNGVNRSAVFQAAARQFLQRASAAAGQRGLYGGPAAEADAGSKPTVHG